MKKILSLILCIVLLLAMLPLSFMASAADDADAGMLDEIIIKFYDKSLYPGKEKQYDDEVAKVLKDGLSVVTDNVYVVKAEELSKNPNAILNRYKNSKFIEYVEPNYTGEFSAVPNDPNYTGLKALLTVLNAPSGWDIITGGGPIIAVVDSGVVQHADLPKLLPGYSAVAGLSPNNDKTNHGTGVAGTIGALGNNKLGTVGMNWNASIMPVKVDDANGVLSVANIAKGIIWAADNGAKIISLSLGTASDSVTLKNAIDYAYKKGCAIFAAVGNDGKNGISYPARYANVMAVGASGSGTSKAAISNYGVGMGVVAITSYNTTSASGAYASMSGTSFSCPQVSGLATLVWALDPTLTNDEVYSFIQQGAKTLGGGYNEQTGYGVIDIGKTLALVQAGAEPQIVDVTAPVLTLRGSVVMELEQGKAFTDPGYNATDDIDGDVTSKVAVTGSVNVNVPGVYKLEYKVTDAAGNIGTATRVVEVILVDTDAPVLTLKGSDVVILTQGEAYAEPGYTAIDGVDGNITAKVVVNGTVNIDVPAVYTLEYSVADAAGNTATAKREVEVMAISNEPAPSHPKDTKPTDIQSFLLEAPTGSRNDYAGSVGYEFQCLENIEVSYIGRPLNGTMNYTHTVYIWEVSTKTLLATADVRPDSPLDVLGFKVAELDHAITLKAGEKYRIVSAEKVGGDKWYDISSASNMIPNIDCIVTGGAFTAVGGQDTFPDSLLEAGRAKGYAGVTFYYSVVIEQQAVEPEPEPVQPTPVEPVVPPVEPPVEPKPPVIPAEPEPVVPVEPAPTEPVAPEPDPVEPTPVEPEIPTTPTEPEPVEPVIPSEPEPVETSEPEPVTPEPIAPVVPEPEPPKPVYKNPPVITLKGATEVTLYVDEEYIEAGYKAVDCFGVNLTGAVRVTGNVNIWTPGTYKMDYYVEDSGGNAARATRTVFVIEREVEPVPPAYPVLTIVGSDPIVLHLGSGTPYTEQGAQALDELDGDISGAVKISGNLNRDKAGTYTVTYSVVNSAGLTASATRTVRILEPDEVKEPRTTYNFSGSGKAGAVTTHKNVICDAAGYMDFSVTALDKNMSVKVELKSQSTGKVAYSSTFTGVGGTQFWVDEGKYDVNVTITSGNGNCKYGVRLITPELIYFIFEEEEVPLFDPVLILHYISEGYSPLEICLNLNIEPEDLNGNYMDFIAAGWTEEELEWFGLTYVPVEEAPPEVPSVVEEPVKEQPVDDGIVTYVVVSGDSLSLIAKKLLGDSTRWREIYDMNKGVIGSNPNLIFVGQELKVKIK